MTDESRTFVRVYMLPRKLTDGYCFQGGVPIAFQNVDWFEALVSGGRDRLADFVKKKRYYKPSERFLVLGDHPDFTFTIDPEKKPDAL